MNFAKSLFDEGRVLNINVSAICPAGLADELVDVSPEDILRNEKIDPVDIAETALYLARASCCRALGHRESFRG